jgi:Domain of Unknown Function (DUF1080)
MKQVAWLVLFGMVLFGNISYAADALLTAEEIAQGWISLFDGETTFGWKAHSNADWKVEDGTLTATTGDQGMLCTTSNFADYTLKLEFKAEKNTNSGVFLRTAPVVNKEEVATECYELNIANEENPFPTGSLVGRVKNISPAQHDGWRSFEVTLQGPQVTVQYNGQKIVEYIDKQPLGRGLIGLQFKEGKIAFRNIKLKPLNTKSIFNGRDLAGWKEYPEMASKFSVTPKQELNVVNGKGQLESTNQYGDFLLQFDCITHAKLLNSGIFFRCIPGEQMNGYECQIQNGFKDNDRNKPVDCGTGGIYRRIDARRVVADDESWFTTTLVATGDHISVWVNGFQVTDWTDTRKPDANPRKGLRTEPGTFMIQGHDPTTNISFRNLQVQELPPRKSP